MDADVERTAIASPDRHHRSLPAVVSRLAEHAATISLFIVFCVAVTPIGIVRSCLGRSAIERGRRVDALSYRTKRRARNASHLTKQY
jgi:hypothetical protein